MIGFAKVAVLGAALSFSAVTAYEMPVRQLEAAVGKYQDRIPASAERPLVTAASVETTGSVMRTGASGKGDRLASAQSSGRVITVESRVGSNTSVLTRIAPAAIANR
jgi:hypothetical protein